MRVEPTENGLHATNMTPREQAGIENQLQANKIDYNVSINYDTMQFELDVDFDDMYANTQQVSGPFYQVRSHTR